MERKTCKKCKKVFPLSNFHNRSDDHGDGHFSHCKDCENERGRIKYWKYHEKQKLRGRVKNQRNRDIALEYYGKFCKCCGEENRVFLTIDHVDNDGKRHRKELNGKSIYIWLRKNNYPKNYQTLCRNCNWAKQYGECPHQRNHTKI